MKRQESDFIAVTKSSTPTLCPIRRLCSSTLTLRSPEFSRYCRREPRLPEDPPTAPRSERRVYLDDWIGAPVYDFDAVAPAQKIAGPAIIGSAMTTVLLRPSDRGIVTKLG